MFSMFGRTGAPQKGDPKDRECIITLQIWPVSNLPSLDCQPSQQWLNFLLNLTQSYISR